MDVTNIASVATSLSSARTNQEVGIAILKKAMDISAEGALALIEAIPDSQPTQSLPAHLGKNINTTA